MKKIFLILVILSLFCVSCGEKSAKDERQQEELTKEIKYLQPSCFTLLQNKEEYYEIYTDEEGTGYYYIIYNKQRSIIDEGYCSWKFDNIVIKDNLLELTYGTSGGPLFKARYYDLQKDKVSRVFNMPLNTSKNLIAYFERSDVGIKLVVQDIFDSSMYYEEFYDESFSTLVFLSKGSAMFEENNKKIVVTYPNHLGETVSKTFELSII